MSSHSFSLFELNIDHMKIPSKLLRFVNVVMFQEVAAGYISTTKWLKTIFWETVGTPTSFTTHKHFVKIINEMVHSGLTWFFITWKGLYAVKTLYGRTNFP